MSLWLIEKVNRHIATHIPLRILYLNKENPVDYWNDAILVWQLPVRRTSRNKEHRVRAETGGAPFSYNNPW